MEFDSVDSVVKVGASSTVGAIALRMVWNWFNRERQDSSLYKNELAAHEETKKELLDERRLRKEVEVELQESREAHERDRTTWYEERAKDREMREQLRNEIFELRQHVQKLEASLQAKGLT